MLPASTGDRKQRDVTKGRPDGRTVEIQRLIGRSLRGVVDFEALGERTIYLDCDVLQADGGTRCASITGAYVALALALRRAASPRASSSASPLTGSVAAVSCGIVGGVAAARPRLPRGLDGRGRRQRRHDRRRRPGRGPGDRRAHAALARAPRRAAGARRSAASSELRAVQAEAIAAPAAMRLVLATRNAHKVREFARAAGAARGRPAARRASRCRPRPATTFAENALVKARAAAAATGRAGDRRRLGHRGRGARRRARACARRATPARTRPTRRTSPSCCARRRRAARCAYVCALAYVDPRRRPSTSSRAAARARWPPSRAATGGFGYDPAFVPDDLDDGRTMAELAPDEKDAISHRGRAARELLAWLQR